jgi:hypothetical protein
MGFMDKAKKMAEQAQQKLDEVQKDFNKGQGSGQQQGGPAVEYDKHGRPVNAPQSADAPPAPAAAAPPPAAEPAAAPPPGDPLAEPTTPAASTPTEFVEAQESGEPAKAQGDPLLDESDRKSPPAPGSAPGMTSGDPLG